MMISINIVIANMKNSLYDRLESATTADLLKIRDMYAGMISRREKTPRHDYQGKCVIRCTQILENRGVLPLLPRIRRKRFYDSSENEAA